MRPLNETDDLERVRLRPDTLNDTNKLELSVFASDEQEQVWLCRLNLQGRTGAVQNMNSGSGSTKTLDCERRTGRQRGETESRAFFTAAF